MDVAAKLSVAPYSGGASSAVSGLSLCLDQLILNPVGASSKPVTLSFGGKASLGISRLGADLGTLRIPLGTYSRLALKLSNLCGVPYSLRVSNAQGDFSATEEFQLNFDGEVKVVPDTEILFSVQAIVDKLAGVTANQQVLEEASSSAGRAFTGGAWTPLSMSGAPSARDQAMSVWTGHEFLIWGGQINYNWLGTGGRYDPGTNTWRTMASGAGAPSPNYAGAFVWTGSEMLIWSGQSLETSGYRYNPESDSWAAMTTANAPSPRHSPAFTWTGQEMLVWGGFDGAKPVNTGGRYNPITNQWTSMTTVGAPPAAAFQGHSVAAVWTGTEMLVWGGDGVGDQFVATGGRYNPSSNTWAPISNVGAPSARRQFTPIWTGSELIIWGGYNGNPFGDGARYNPVTNTWRPMSMIGAPTARDSYVAAWTGSKMIVWGGNENGAGQELSDGGIYDPQTDTWTAIPALGDASLRMLSSSAWTGSQFLVWGGSNHSSFFFNSGGLFSP